MKNLLTGAQRPLLLFLLMIIVPQWVAAESLATMLEAVRSTQAGESDSGGYTPSEKELAMAEGLFRRVLAGESGPRLRQQWAELGFELTGTRSESIPMLVLQEIGGGSTQSKFLGKGFFAFAVGRESKTVLQVPHSFADADTRVIALELMARYNFRAAAWNTAPATLPVHSSLPPDLQPPPRKDFMLAFTRALLFEEPESRVVQLHSFEKTRMYSSNARHADIILSGYGESSNQAIGWLSRCLKKNLNYKVRTFPFEVQEMGAGKRMAGANENLIGAVMQAFDSQGFLHVAMSEGFREELRVYPQVQKALFACLGRE
ncbi:MAG TPA: hypothetical protein ENI97_04655 [Gammaproteobacteria bacterium]|nr:hypothetical protein [Gammaproteobacteria bacterium]